MSIKKWVISFSLLGVWLGIGAKLGALEDQAKKLYLFNWSEYLPDTVIKEFEQESGIKVFYSTYDSNEAMYAKVKIAQKNAYDLIVPTSGYVHKMGKEGLLETLDKSKLKNFANLDPKFLNKAFDQQNTFSIPYLWGTTVIAYNDQKVKENEIGSWQDLWNKGYKKKLVFLNDSREAFWVAAKILGYSGNTTDPTVLAKMYEKLQGLMGNIKIFDSQSPKSALLSGEVPIGVLWNGEYYMAHKENAHIKAVLPKEGLFFFVDNLAIPKNARNKEGAYRLIDFILRKEVGKKIAETLGYSTPNLAAYNILEASFKNNPIVYPAHDLLMKGEFQEDIGSAAPLYASYWEKLKAL